jgi:predicted nucleic acid-binding protein
LILVDSSAIVALVAPRDQHHADAASAWKSLRAEGEKLLLTDLIVAEMAIVLRRRAGHAAALRALDLILSSRVVEIVHTDPPLLEAGAALFRRYRDQDLSLCDCVSAALLKQRKLHRVFTFDDDFAVLGFERVPGTTSPRR